MSKIENQPLQTTTRKNIPWKNVLTLSVSFVLLSLVLYSTDLNDLAQLASKISFVDIIVVTSLLVLNQAISSVRFYILSKEFNVHLDLPQTHRTNIYSLVGSVLFFNIVGQSLTRSGIFRAHKKPIFYGFYLTVLERSVSLLCLFLIATISVSLYLGNLSLDLQDHFTALGIVTSLCLTALLVWKFGLPSQRKQQIKQLFFPKKTSSTVLIFVLSIIMHLTMALAYMVLAFAILPNTIWANLFLVSTITMLGASFPISFNGWGIRELTAGYIFAYTNMPTEAGVTVGFGIGLLSLLALLLNVLLLNFIKGEMKPASSNTKTEQPSTGKPPIFSITPLLIWAFPLLATVLLSYQIVISTFDAPLSLNGADIFAVLGAGLFLLQLRPLSKLKELWVFPQFNTALLLMFAAIICSFAYGYINYGLISWAFLNRLIGTGILAGYMACGVLIVTLVGDEGRKSLLKTIILSITAIIIVQWIGLAAKLWIGEISRVGLLIQHIGFVQNPNAYAFIIAIGLCVLLSGYDFWPKRNWVPILLAAIMLAGIKYTESRTGLVAIIIVLIVLRFIRPFPILKICLAGFAMYALSRLCYLTPVLLYDGVKGLDGVTPAKVLIYRGFEYVQTDRYESTIGAINMWLEHPLFGAGLGAFIAQQIASSKPLIVIHSGYLWIMAEMGLIGLAAFAYGPIMLFKSIFTSPNWRDNPNYVGIIGLLVLMGSFSVLHDMTYQRSFWLILAVFLAAPNVLNKNNQT